MIFAMHLPASDGAQSWRGRARDMIFAMHLPASDGAQA
jgi:hypothetical protein